MQPTYNPWIGYFDLMGSIDVFVYLDDVQLVRRSWQVRNRIKTSQGELFLSIPLKKTSRREEVKIKDAYIDDSQPWRQKHLKAINLNYKKAPYYEEVFPFVKNLIEVPFDKLTDFNINFIEKVKDKIGIRTQTIRSYDLKVDGKKDEKLSNICKKLGCDTYISPQGSAEYLEKEKPGGLIVKNGINLFYHNYIHPAYRQVYGEFLPYMGVIDLLFNEGFDNALKIIRSGRKEPIHYLVFRKNFLQDNENENSKL
jgi:hypothetical protein